MTYEHPLAYVVGLQGAALLRAFAGDHDRAFVEARLAEVRRLLDDPGLQEGVEVETVDAATGYRAWAASYDDGDNPAFADEPFVAEVLEGLAPGVALDAACGTGRHAAALADRGHEVVGVDVSPDMLEHARRRVQGGDFRTGTLTDLPVADATVDVAVCALALTHLPAVGPAVAELARVLRPGGHLVLADVHPTAVALGSVPAVRSEDGSPARIVSRGHGVGDYVRAALAAGLRVERCEEPLLPTRAGGSDDAPRAATDPGPWDAWPWSLRDLVPEAAAAVTATTPMLLLWHLVRPG